MNKDEQELTFKSLFLPFTTKKAVISIIVVGFIVFFNMFLNGFVWDDKGYIIQNSLVYSINIPVLFGKNIYNTVAQYRPLPALYFAFAYSLFTTTPFFYHVLQLLLHIINTLLVFYLLKHFLKQNISFFLSLIFLVHPLQVESVSYIASSGNPLFFLFGISALLLSLKDKITWKLILGISSLLFLSLLTKETGILFILLIISYRLIFKKPQKLIFISSSAVALMAYLFLRFIEVGSQYKQLALSPIAGLSVSDRLLNIPAILMYYLGNFFYPARLVIEQLWIIKAVNASNFYIPLFIVSTLSLLLCLIGFYIFHKHKKTFPAFLFFLLWTLLGFGMYSQIVPLDMTVADRWFYFPVIGLLGLIGVTLQTFKTSQKVKIVGLVIGISFIALLSTRTMVRNTNWVDAITLYTHDSKIGNNYDLENNLGSEYFNSDNYSEALTHFKKSESLLPYELNTYNLGVTYENLGDFPKAKAYFNKLINKKDYLIEPRYRQKAFEGIAKIQAYKEKPTIATVEFIRNALRQYPDSGYLWAALAYADYKLGNNADALKAALKAKNILPLPLTNYFYMQILNNKEIDMTQLK